MHAKETAQKNTYIPQKKQPYPPILKVKLTKKDYISEGLFQVQEHLVRFGYMKHESYTLNKLDEATSEAISKFQDRFRLEKTGWFDQNTRAQMGALRCGLPDMRLGI